MLADDIPQPCCQTRTATDAISGGGFWWRPAYLRRVWMGGLEDFDWLGANNKLLIIGKGGMPTVKFFLDCINIKFFCIAISVVLVSACASSAKHSSIVDLQQQVFAIEYAFAQSMADRDFDAFTFYLDEETVFFSGNNVLRGKQKVADAWQGYFTGDQAPFSWQPDTVEVLESGSLALSSGPVFDPAGNLIGQFNSIWRREPLGVWRIVFDKGSDVCISP